MLLCTFINQYEDLGNLYYLTCFKPYNTAFKHLFHKKEKILDGINGYWFEPIDTAFRHLFHKNEKLSDKIAGYQHFFTELLKWRINFLRQSGRALHRKTLSKLIKTHYLHWVFYNSFYKNHTHVKKVGCTSEFLFGIYWWTWKTNMYKKNCWSGLIKNKIILIFNFNVGFFFWKRKNLEVSLSKSRWYDLQFLIYRVKQSEIGKSFFTLLPL